MIRSRRVVELVALALLTAGACGRVAPTAQLKLAPLKTDEAMDDFEQMVNAFKGVYGLMRLKVERYGLNLGEMVETTRVEIASARSDEEIYGALRRFVTKFHDGHLSLTFPYAIGKIKRHTIPLFVAPFDDKFGIAFVEPEAASSGVAVGDELLAMDGRTPDAWLEIINRYMTWGNARSDRNNICMLFSRDVFMTELMPTQSTTLLKLRRADGTEYEASLPWKAEDYYPGASGASYPAGDATVGRPMAYAAHAGLMNEAAGSSKFRLEWPQPFFVTPALSDKFSLTEVTIDPAYLTKYRLDPAQNKYKEVYAATYAYDGRKFLLIRQPSYNVESDEKTATLLNVYRAILDQYEGQVAALVIDQNHNPGGYLSYVSAFFKLFITEATANLIERPRADRKWITELLDYARSVDPTMASPDARKYAGYAAGIEAANDRGDAFGPFVTWSEGWTIQPDSMYTWKKPILILADELSGSCADIFPMLMTRAHRAKFFGARTAGLGGSVEDGAILNHSQGKLALTRGMFNSYRADNRYDEDSWIENSGIPADYDYTMSLGDLRQDFIPYFTHMNEVLKQLLPAGP